MSAFLRLKRREMEEDCEPNLVPIMNMFLVLIPFLLMSASFYHIKAVNTSVPILASSNGKAGEDKDKTITVTVIAELKKDSLKLSAMSDKLSGDELNQLKVEYPMDSASSYPLDKFTTHLQGIKNQYPKSDTLILIPNETTDYDTIIHAMDAARKSDEINLFPNVVLSGSVG